jgi:hypothetical protein
MREYLTEAERTIEKAAEERLAQHKPSWPEDPKSGESWDGIEERRAWATLDQSEREAAKQTLALLDTISSLRLDAPPRRRARRHEGVTMTPREHLTEAERAIEARADAAIGGPWEPDIDTGEWTGKVYCADRGERGDTWASYEDTSSPEMLATVYFFCAARTDVPTLLDTISSLRRDLAKAQDLVADRDTLVARERDEALSELRRLRDERDEAKARQGVLAAALARCRCQKGE